MTFTGITHRLQEPLGFMSGWRREHWHIRAHLQAGIKNAGTTRGHYFLIIIVEANFRHVPNRARQ